MFRLRMLGGFAMEGPGGSVLPPLPQRRAEAVLAVLAVCGDMGCTRDRLIALLWPERDQARSRHGLRDALHDIRRALGPAALRSGGDRLKLDPAAVTSDVAEASQALASGRRADAVELFGGPLLDGFHVESAPEFERWLDAERARLGREHLEAIERLAKGAEGAAAWEEAARWWARAVEHDPLNSHLVLRQAEALATLGDRANAIKAADAHVRRLREEMDLEPDGEVVARIEGIRRGVLVAPPARPAMPGASPPPERAATSSEGAAPAPRLERPLPRWAPWAALTMLGVLLGVLAVRARGHPAPTRYPRTAIAVLPFQNLSPDWAHAYFAVGLHDELLAQLAKVAALRVVGRTSVGTYRDTSKPLRQIGEELAVGSIVEGSVQVVGNRLRVIVQLVDPVTETDLWAEHYDRTVDEAFAVQSDIAQCIVAAVGATLESAEASAIAAAPTLNAEAYQLYLQGLEYWRRPREIGARLEIAQQLFRQALALDPSFALAHAALSLVDAEMYLNLGDPSPARAGMQRAEADTALRLAPDLPRAHLAMGVVYHAR